MVLRSRAFQRLFCEESWSAAHAACTSIAGSSGGVIVAPVDLTKLSNANEHNADVEKRDMQISLRNLHKFDCAGKPRTLFLAALGSGPNYGGVIARSIVMKQSRLSRHWPSGSLRFARNDHASIIE